MNRLRLYAWELSANFLMAIIIMLLFGLFTNDWSMQRFYPMLLMCFGLWLGGVVFREIFRERKQVD